MTSKQLRGCPTCGTKVAETNLGLRDYSWVNPLLPGKVGLMDIDGLLERRGKVLIHEYKPAAVAPTKGQLMTFRTLRKMGAEVWTIQGDGPLVDVNFGDGLVSHLPVSELAAETVRWYNEAGEVE